MKVIKSLSEPYVFGLILQGFLFSSPCLTLASPTAPVSSLSGLPLLLDCQGEYRAGIELYQKAVSKRVPNLNSFLDQEYKKVSEKCRADFSVGLIDARIYLQQSLQVEYLLELNFAAREFKENLTGLNNYKLAMQNLFAEKLKLSYLAPDLLSQASLDSPEVKKAMAELTLGLISQARVEKKPVQFGRFIFTGAGRPFTNFEYVIGSDGRLEELPSGELKVNKGSYQLRAEALIRAAIDVAEAYLAYRPKMVIGEDSLLTATLEGMIWKTPFDQTLRGKREATPFQMIDAIAKVSSEMYLDSKPFFQIQRHMYEKQNAVLERDVKATKMALTGMVLLPVLPYAIRFGSWMLSSYGTKLALEYVAEGAVWKLNVGAFLYSHATTISVLSSLIAVVGTRGVQIYDAIQAHRKDPKNFTLGHVLDASFVSLVSSVPLAAAAPIFVAGATIAGIHSAAFLTTETTQFLAQMGQGFRYAQSVGWKQALLQAAKTAPREMLKAWCNAWWTKGPTGIVVNTKFIAMIASYNTASIVAEIASREMKSDPDQKFFTPDGINKLSVYSLSQKIAVSIITGPIIKIDNFWGRWLAWRFVDFVSSGVVTFIVDGGKVNMPYVQFETVYGATVSSATGEVERVLQMAVLNSNMPTAHSFLIQTVMKLGFLFPKAALRTTLMDIYFGKMDVSPEHLLEMMRADIGFEFKNISREAIEAGIEEFRRDPEVPELMKLPLGAP